MSEAKLLVEHFKKLGIEVHTRTKARGHQGFFINNRIDISKDIPEYRFVPTLLHEFAHYIHSKIETDINKTGGTFLKLFKQDNSIIKSELVKVTHFIDKNSLCETLHKHQNIVKSEINYYTNEIKRDYPKFQRSKKFKEFNRYIKHTNAKYLLKYDRVRVITGFFARKSTLYSIDNIEKDFTDMPRAFVNYIKLHSYQKKQSRIAKKLNYYRKYYEKPTELFARFVEALYVNKQNTTEIAPYTSEIFYKLLNEGYYGELAGIIK